ncbi:peptidase inhibitor family I36 protein [Streptomyces sp. NPDC054796]
MRAVHACAVVMAAGALLQLAAAPAPLASAAPSKKPQPRLGECGAGELCLWEAARFEGERQTYELSDVDIESCVPLPKGTEAASFANRTGRPVTVYQSAECAETAEFSTHPSGSWTPEGAYRVRAFKVWEN